MIPRKFILLDLFRLLIFVEYLKSASILGDVVRNSTLIKNAFIGGNFGTNAAGKYYDIPDSNPAAVVSGVAVFLLGTLFSEAPHFFYERSVVARLTWARHAKIFYTVTGKGGPEQKAFQNPNLCRNVTDHLRKVVGNVHPKPYSFEVYHCGPPEQEVNVLHLPRCTAEYAGAQGPCCRCEGAMMFYSALHKAHVATGHNSGFPQWFVFADDDYFIRLNYLEAILENPATPYERPYALVSSTGFDTDLKSAHEKGNTTERPNFGLFRHNGGNCTVPCVHRVPWMGWGGYSIAAIRLLEQSSLNNEGLINTCVKWDVTHDIGLGIYTWMHSIQVIDIRLGEYNGFKELNQYRKEDVHWHKPWGNGMKVDELFDLILKCGDVNAEFDLKKYIDCERELGRQYNAQHNRMVPYGVFKNTMFYRRMAYYREIASQVQESQRTANLKLDVTDYVPNMCTEDKMLFEGWEATRPWSKEKHNTHGLVNGQPQECLEYTEYIHNLPVKISDADLPPLDDLIRKRHLR